MCLTKQMTDKTKFYLSTAINYTNGLPHMGHAYEAVIGDCISRFHRSLSHDVFFLTGTDEHGQKIANTAEAQNKTPIELCDFYANAFQTLNAKLNISNDRYIRTSSASHKKTAQALWNLAKNNNDIYLSQYEGWYNTREEAYVPETEAKANNYKDPVSNLPLTKMQEESFFFRQSKYQSQLVQHILDNPTFIQPENRRNEILARLKEPLNDLCISRTKFTWGVPVPDNQEHVMYVWFDALANYISGVNGLKLDHETADFSSFWPCNVHLIGKDIVWFHAVIWPCMLMSAGVALPKTVLCHGFVNGEDGRKMSKSLGNVVDPWDMINFVGSDSFRFFVMYACRLGEDFPFVASQMRDLHNGVLNDQLGNLVHRSTNLAGKLCGGEVPMGGEGEEVFDVEEVVAFLEKGLEEFKLQECLEKVVEVVGKLNKYLQVEQPWSKEKSQEERWRVMEKVLNGVFAIGALIEPFMPESAEKLFQKFDCPRVSLAGLKKGFRLEKGVKVTVGEPLFSKVK